MVTLWPLWAGLGVVGVLCAGAFWIARAPTRRLLREAKRDPQARLLSSSAFSEPCIEFEVGKYRGRFRRRWRPPSWTFEVVGVQLSNHLSMRVHRVDKVSRLLQRTFSAREKRATDSPLSGLRITSTDDDLLRAILRHENVQRAFEALFTAFPLLHEIEIDAHGALRCSCPARNSRYESGRHGVLLLLQLVKALDAHRTDKRALSPQMRVQLTGLGSTSGQPFAVGSAAATER